MKLLFTKIRRKLIQNTSLSKIIHNISWLSFDKFLRMGLGLFIEAWVTRYLGPELFGIQNFSIAIISFFIPFIIFGLNSIAVKNLVNHPERTNEILGNAFFLQVLTALLCFIILIFIVTFYFDDELSKLTTIIIGFSLLFKPMDTIRYYFDSHTQSKFIVLADNISFIICSLLKVAMILIKAPFIVFIWIFLLNIALSTLLLLIFYKLNKQTIASWKINFKLIRQDISSCIPLIFAGLTIIIYMRIDQIMLSYMMDYNAVGIYSAAIRLSEIWYFIPVIVSTSVTPMLIRLRSTSSELFHETFTVITCSLTAIFLFLSFAVTVFANPIINILYGQAYQAAANVLIVHIWTGIFVCLSVMGGQWLIIESLPFIHLYRSLFGAIINIIANLILIPLLGTIGAAISTLIAQICASFLFDLFNKKTHKIFWIKVKSLNIFYTIKLLKKQLDKA